MYKAFEPSIILYNFHILQFCKSNQKWSTTRLYLWTNCKRSTLFQKIIRKNQTNYYSKRKISYCLFSTFYYEILTLKTVTSKTWSCCILFIDRHSTESLHKNPNKSRIWISTYFWQFLSPFLGKIGQPCECQSGKRFFECCGTEEAKGLEEKRTKNSKNSFFLKIHSVTLSQSTIKSRQQSTSSPTTKCNRKRQSQIRQVPRITIFFLYIP